MLEGAAGDITFVTQSRQQFRDYLNLLFSDEEFDVNENLGTRVVDIKVRIAYDVEVYDD